MVWAEQAEDPLYKQILPVASGLGLALVEFSVSRHKGSVSARLTVFKKGGVGVDDCAAIHRAAQGYLEIAFPESAVYIEASSPGIGRIVKEPAECRHYIEETLRVYVLEQSEWTSGVLKRADKTGLALETENGLLELTWDKIGKIKLV